MRALKYVVLLSALAFAFTISAVAKDSNSGKFDLQQDCENRFRGTATRPLRGAVDRPEQRCEDQHPPAWKDRRDG